MARRRMIDPNFWQSEDVSNLSIRQRLLLIGLFSNADDEGRLRGNPAFVRSLVFPYEDFTLTEIEGDLNKVESVGSIHQYTVEGSKYIRLVNWKKFQRVDKPQPSVIPEPIENHSKNDSENDSGTSQDSLLRKEEEEKIREGKLREEEVNADSSETDPFIHVITEFCNLHNKLDIHLKATEREDAHKLLNDGISSEFIISSMKKIHKQRTEKGEKITSLSYYKGAISDAWKGELDNEKYKGLQSQGSARESERDEEQGGWLPSKYNTPEQLALLPKVSGQ